MPGGRSASREHCGERGLQAPGPGSGHCREPRSAGRLGWQGGHTPPPAGRPHTGLVPDVLDLFPEATVLGSRVCLQFLDNLMHRPFKSRVRRRFSSSFCIARTPASAACPGGLTLATPPPRLRAPRSRAPGCLAAALFTTLHPHPHPHAHPHLAGCRRPMYTPTPSLPPLPGTGCQGR